MEYKYKHILTLFVVAIFIFLAFGSDGGGTSIDSSRLDAEEEGYNDRFGSLLKKISSITYDYHKASEEAISYSKINDAENQKRAEEKMQSVYNELKEQATKNIVEDLVQTLPPNNFKTTHIKLVNLLSSVDHENPGSSSLKERCQSFYTTHDELQKSVASRPEVNKRQSVQVSFTPVGSPFSLVYSDKKVSVEFELAINTPIGEIAFSEDDPKGIKTLVINAEGLNRYVRIDRPFQMYVPAKYGVVVKSDGEVLILHVVEKGEQH